MSSLSGEFVKLADNYRVDKFFSRGVSLDQLVHQFRELSDQLRRLQDGDGQP
jgi:hypothetical protein